MNKEIICIECPAGCRIGVDVEDSGAISVTGNKCEKGCAYARKEVTSPERMLTSTVKAEGLDLKRIPVKTDKPVPKGRIEDVMKIIRREKIKRPVKIGDVVVKNVLGLEVDIVVTKAAEAPMGAF
jgi:CxxC motif-containing protein